MKHVQQVLTQIKISLQNLNHTVPVNFLLIRTLFPQVRGWGELLVPSDIHIGLLNNIIPLMQVIFRISCVFKKVEATSKSNPANRPKLSVNIP
jgi:hypothetical protein